MEGSAAETEVIPDDRDTEQDELLDCEDRGEEERQLVMLPAYWPTD